MINTLYTQIKEKEKASFDELFQLNSTTIPTKPELGALLRTLENEKKIFQFAGSYYDLSKFEDVKGYVQWNLTGFCWLSDTNDMNEWGITFNPDDNLLSIYNKRDAQYGAYVQGKKVLLEDREFVFVTSAELNPHVNLIATYQQARNEWVILNSATNFAFKNKLEDVENGQVSIFNTLDWKNYSLQSTMGNMSDFGMETKIIQTLSNITPAPHSHFNVVKTEGIIKLDKPFYTIDSANTKDIDDAIYLEKNNNGYHLWVAIADVSSYVLPGDIQDQHAQQTCTSFYLPHDTVHMLDRQLAENFCSLNPGVTKQSLVCEMRFDLEGKLLTKDFYQAEILSKARLTYHDVDKMITGINPTESLIYDGESIHSLLTYDEDLQLIQSLHNLYAFAQTQERKDEREYFIVEQAEYSLGENGKIDHLYAKEESNPSQKMVETAMLAANICAAQFLYEKYPQFGMFRNQFEPKDDELPKPAFYDFNNGGHWGLKTEFYTHFTSPIRRYCDLLVHRLVKNIILKDEKLYTNEQLASFAEQINLQQYKAKQFNIKSRNLLIPQYVQTLLATNQLDEKINLVDFSDNGIVVQNNQLLEFFVPIFKLEKDITRAIEKLLPQEGKELTLKEKTDAIQKINNEWNMFMKIENFIWTDERKNSYYQITRKNRNNFNKQF